MRRQAHKMSRAGQPRQSVCRLWEGKSLACSGNEKVGNVTLAKLARGGDIDRRLQGRA